jgi:hypothetical protein
MEAELMTAFNPDAPGALMIGSVTAGLVPATLLVLMPDLLAAPAIVSATPSISMIRQVLAVNRFRILLARSFMLVTLF